MKRYIGIDQSLSTTAICILTEYSNEPSFMIFHNSKIGKWHKTLDTISEFSYITYSEYPKDYSTSEILKLNDYLSITNNIIDSLQLTDIDMVVMEGYAMRSKGNVADLFAFGTLLRERICEKTKHLLIVSPMTLKVEFASIMYSCDKKGVYRNSAGIAAGKFTKTEMLQGLFDMQPNIMQKVLSEYKDDLLLLKHVPGPINDCVDAYAAALSLKRKNMV